MKKQITGKEIYSFDNLTVYEHADGYIIADNCRMVIVKQMPCLNANVLRVLLDENGTYYDEWQVTATGNIINQAHDAVEPVPADLFDKWYVRECELQELDAIGY
jgi:DNA-binding protein